ncbi:antibiotic biosynthesis monooxygenase [Listeria monocytogenes]|nr:antibiotic biosynthesis monooxygenase [Listeria monocytogenes]
MLHIQAKIQVKPDSVDAFLAEADSVIQGSLLETGNHGYELVRSVKQANTFYLLEKWFDEAAIQFHNETLHYKCFKKNIPDFLITTIIVDVLRLVEQ